MIGSPIPSAAMPLGLLKEEMDRLTREMATAERVIKDAGKTVGELEATLQAALAIAGDCLQRYALAPPHVRRQLNQGFFTKLFIAEDGSVERAELTEPFASLMEHEQRTSDYPGDNWRRPGGPRRAPHRSSGRDTGHDARTRHGHPGRCPVPPSERLWV